MNKRQVISSLNNIAEELDNQGLYVEAKQVTNVMRKIAQVQEQAPPTPEVLPAAPPGTGSAKEALEFYKEQFLTAKFDIEKELRRKLNVVLANYQDKKQFFNDPTYGPELKKLITDDMNLFNSLLFTIKNPAK